MILSKQSIKEAIESGDISITPFNEGNVNPASYVFTLSEAICLHNHAVEIDMLKDPVCSNHIIGDDGFLLEPDAFVLAQTNEKLSLHGKYSCIFATKASIAKRGIDVLATSIYGEPDTDNHITLEMHNISGQPIRIYKDLRIVKGIFIPVK